MSKNLTTTGMSISKKNKPKNTEQASADVINNELESKQNPYC